MTILTRKNYEKYMKIYEKIKTLVNSIKKQN